jgi:hypothetical protein
LRKKHKVLIAYGPYRQGKSDAFSFQKQEKIDKLIRERKLRKAQRAPRA